MKTILLAYSFYDLKTDYCQGMHNIASWILKHMKMVNKSGEIEYDSVNSFYLFVHIMKVLNFVEVFEPGFPGMLQMIKITEGTL